ncbi:ribosome maturation factor RimM [Companilactobacillus crustorum]|uniref:Ribosome maturation factor RimM n=3 Tax=Companilactobacillus TaxID=2767879 RepID=A0A837RJ33_9LACO|nr:ribosome maturation factor RimM [Companilactobacillus crustorum]HCD07070.1 ribosome maturation factor RimM [Lactobacillus sp.]APU71187.1 Ribosome maturation factor RimM [Companilactobacillus crustorum]KRK43910.1 16S rRNA processing protein RimM [Companilactobacillus crustorum JCM 15951]KRO21349.1 16S rRNA processing protein RimM [Companilactobacillus crustorum]WDT64577.1 ribosome maturation factor RimM [Companilactobacillus crustorum]
MTEKLYRVGTIVNTHGIKGELRVIPITDFPEDRFKSGAKLYLKNKDQTLEFTVESSRPHKSFILLKLKGYDNINDVEKYVKSELFADGEEVSDLNEGEFLYKQIIGLTVVDKELGEVGKVTEIMELGSNDVWVVKSPKYKEILLPYIDDVIKKVDLDNQVVEVEIPDGLID